MFLHNRRIVQILVTHRERKSVRSVAEGIQEDTISSDTWEQSVAFLEFTDVLCAPTKLLVKIVYTVTCEDTRNKYFYGHMSRILFSPFENPQKLLVLLCW